MAIAPVNKFLTVAEPVAPGEQKLYEVPTGTSSILLYAQVANIGVGTYPTVTLIHRRESRSTGNTRDIRVIKDIEVPPNDAAILVDGRIILEKTPLIADSLYLQANQTGIQTVFGVTYDEPVGVITVTTMSNHGFSAGDQVTLAGISFECTGGSGITTTIFPDPQQSYTIDSVPTSDTFVSFIGSAAGITHTYQSAIHTFIRSKPNSVNVVGSSDEFTPSAASYTGETGNLVLTINGHGLTTSDSITIDDSSLIFTCTQDNNSTEHAYPRPTDPASTSNSALNNGVLSITSTTVNTLTVNVGLSTAGGLVAPLQMEILASILENSTV